MSYSGRTLQALELAMNLHRDQKRKGTDIPYITHLWAVASIVGENGGTEDQVIAALLHDAIEDQGDKISQEQIEEQFGTRVAEIVKACTDADSQQKKAEKGDLEKWRERKQRYIEHLRSAPHYVKLVSAADKKIIPMRTSGPALRSP
jgi:(p)ppGpp synthase/HD superfamily hydrolase